MMHEITMLLRRWLAVGLIVALVTDGIALAAFAADDGDHGDWEAESGQWHDDDGLDDDNDWEPATGDSSDDGDDWEAPEGDWNDGGVTDGGNDDRGDDDDDDDNSRQRERRSERRGREGGRSAQTQSALLVVQNDDDDDDDDDHCEIEDDDNPATDGFCDDQAIVRLSAGVNVGAINSAYDTETIDTIAGQRLFLLQLPDNSIETSFADLLMADDRVTWAEPNYVDQAPEGSPRRFYPSSGSTPIPGSLDQSYAPTLIGAEAAAACVDGSGVTVAVIDSGIDADHPAFAATTIRNPWNAFSGEAGHIAAEDAGNGEDDDGDGSIDEMTGHGTHVAGIVAQIAPNAAIMPIKALDSDGVGQAFYLARAMYRALDQNADVINLSLGSTQDTRIVRDAATDATSAGVFLAAAAGNSGGSDFPEYPATLDSVFGVAATDSQDNRTEFTSLHSSLDLSAPGLGVVSAFPADQPPLSPLGSNYALWSGTSMSTPWVAGAAALLLERNPGWTPTRIGERLQASAAPIAGAPAGMGSGRLDVAAAVGCDQGATARGDGKQEKKAKKGKKGQGKKGKDRR